ncbi:MAG: endopeptidase La, partial [Clostridiales bacterium]|nr:endopeptidase La [Clostridiales bacterium]
PFFEVKIKNLDTQKYLPNQIEANRRELYNAFLEFKKYDFKISQQELQSIPTDDAERFMYAIANLLFVNDADKQRILSEPSIILQIEECIVKIMKEIELLQLEQEVQNKVRKRIDKSQREYYLREQQKVIMDELGDNEDETISFRKKIAKFGLNEDDHKKLLKELTRLEKTSQSSPEYGMIRAYFDTLCDLPWNKSKAVSVDLKRSKIILDDCHYGLDVVKTRIIEFLAVNKLTDNSKSPILCFVGPPGVGKTSIVESIAKASGRKLVTMSLGGVRDEAEIRGHRRTYIGAIPGRIINGLVQVGVNNPVFLLDEVDKMASDFKGDPAAALLEVLDSSINKNFKDHYLEVSFDISKVIFVTTANSLENIPLPLLDRLEVIELSGYTFEEKLEIAKRYLVPKQLQNNGLKECDIKFEDKALTAIIENYTRESGVRQLEREISSVCRKIAVKIVQSKEQGAKTERATIDDIVPYLGSAKYEAAKLINKDEVGIANGLAWTAIGGKLLSVEVTMVPGKGDLNLTGSLGNIMKESCLTAITVVKSRAKKFEISESIFKDHDFHIHFPEGATPKDGPSAGITIATALLSCVSGVPVDSNVAMTGEVSLRGNVLAIGGLKEKTQAAFRFGIKTIILAESNKKDLDDIPQSVKNNVDIVWVKTVDEVFEKALVYKKRKK